MAEAPYAVRRANPRFSFFADAEVTLRDGTGVRAQLAELSSRGCYIDTLEPIPVRTKLRLRICDGMSYVAVSLPGLSQQYERSRICRLQAEGEV